MHFRTHVKPESRGQSGRWQSEYHDVMIDHDKNVGAVLKALDDAGIADNTFVMYSTDNGPNMFSWPDGGDDAVPEREEHQLGGRLSGAVRGPLARQDQAGQRVERDRSPITTGCRHSSPWPATRRSRDKLLKGYTIGDMTYKVHLDGYNLVPYLTGEVREEPAGVVHLLQRRPAARGAALRQLEDRVRGTAAARHDAGLVRAVRHASRAKDVQSPHRSRSSVPTSPRSPITIGWSITSTCWCRRRPMSGNSCRPSGNTRSARRPPASTSTTCSGRCRRATHT